MLGDVIADLIREVIVHPVLRALDVVVGGVKRNLSRLQSDSDDRHHER